MASKRDLNDNDAYHLNFGVPLVIGLILFLINMEFYVIVFLEKLSSIVTIYMYVSFTILAAIFLLSKKNNEGVRQVLVSFYDMAVHNSALVLIFLLVNYSFSEPVLERTIEYNINYKHALSKADISEKHLKVFEPRYDEISDYYNKGYNIEVRIDKSIFGYEFIKQRDFVPN